MSFLIGGKNIVKQGCFPTSSNFEVNENTFIQYSDKKISTFKTNKSFSLMIGTPLYKGVKFEDILKTVTTDYLNEKLNRKEIKGNYLVLIIQNKEINVLVDRTNQHSVFYDKKTGYISNSFLSLLENTENVYEINRLGLYEKIALGFNIGEDTIFKDIIKLTPHNGHFMKEKSINFYFQDRLVDLESIQFHNKGRKKSIEKQNDHLSKYFRLIDKTFTGKQGDLGLSGGFDCRLLLALADNELSSNLHLHTHATIGAHEGQQKYAEKLGVVYGEPITKIKTKLPLELSEGDLQNMLSDNLNSFDGRSARHLGAFSETYTQSYKKRSMGTAYYSINGLGGEIYRDSYFTGNKQMNWEEWCDRYLFLPLTKDILPQNILQELSMYLKEKIKLELPWNKKYYDILFTHAYYGLIKMPQCNGNLVAAYNKTSPFLLPFVEYDNVIEALKATPYLGVGGGYQAKMISELSYDLAKQPNHYGHSFSDLGFKYFVWSFLKTKGSTKRREALVSKKLKARAATEQHKEYLSRLNSKEIINESLGNLKQIVPELNIPLALVESTHSRSLIYLAYFLNEYSNKLTHE